MAGSTVKEAARVAELPYPAAKRHIRSHRGATALLAGLAAIVETFERASGHVAMTWQRQMLEETRDTLLVKGRQVGATEVAAALAIHTARRKAGSTSAQIVQAPTAKANPSTTRSRRRVCRLTSAKSKACGP